MRRAGGGWQSGVHSEGNNLCVLGACDDEVDKVGMEGKEVGCIELCISLDCIVWLLWWVSKEKKEPDVSLCKFV